MGKVIKFPRRVGVEMITDEDWFAARPKCKFRIREWRFGDSGDFIPPDRFWRSIAFRCGDIVLVNCWTERQAKAAAKECLAERPERGWAFR
jgi:hypothetical protein